MNILYFIITLIITFIIIGAMLGALVLAFRFLLARDIRKDKANNERKETN